MCYNTQKKKAAGAGKDFTLFFGVMLHFNFKCAFVVTITEIKCLSKVFMLHTIFLQFFLYNSALLSGQPKL